MTEKEEAVRLANAVLEKPYIDPDGDISVLARQFLRAREEIDVMRDALEDAQVEMRFVRTFVCSPQRIQEPTGLSLYDETLAKIGAVLDNFTVPHAMATTNPRDATIARLSAELALTREALDRYAALDPDGARAVLAGLSPPASPDRLSSHLAAAREALMRIDVIIETGKVNHAKVAQKVARAVLAKLGEQSENPAPDLRVALAEAREALEPFATHADLYDVEPVNKPDDFELGYGVGLMMQKTHAITIGHFRRARRARAVLAKLVEGA